MGYLVRVNWVRWLHARFLRVADPRSGGFGDGRWARKPGGQKPRRRRSDCWSCVWVIRGIFIESNEGFKRLIWKVAGENERAAGLLLFKTVWDRVVLRFLK
jgi:hypothetical protein